MAISKTQAYCLSKDKVLHILAIKAIDGIVSRKLQCLKALSMSELKSNYSVKVFKE